MADAVDIWFVLEIGIILGLMVSTAPLAWWLQKWRHRHDVWDLLKLGSTRWLLRRVKPDGQFLRTDQGTFLIQDPPAGNYKGLPLFIHKQGDSYPIRLETNRVFSEIEDKKTGEKKTVVQEITNAQTAHISERELATIERARTFAQIYGGAPLITLLLIVILVLVFIGIVVNVVH